MKCFFDVGANLGQHSIYVANEYPEANVYAFEPNQKLSKLLFEKTKNINNYHVIDKAVSNFEGITKFYECDTYADGGCGSILQFADDIEKNWFADWKSTDSYDVSVITLESFIENNKIEQIDYLHCDAQGSDLNVLIGLGKYIEIVNEGILEAASKPDILYKKQNHKDDCINFLIDHGFTILRVFNNDEFANEVNIHYKR